jgi:hypothetical protein
MHLVHIVKMKGLVNLSLRSKNNCLDLRLRNLFPRYRLGIYVQPIHNLFSFLMFTKILSFRVCIIKMLWGKIYFGWMRGFNFLKNVTLVGLIA